MKPAGLVLSLALLAPGLFAQTGASNNFNAGCDEKHKSAILTPADPAYPYAIELAKFLIARGVNVQCICGSKMQHFFPEQRSAAWFQTGNGIFEALFLPSHQNFHVELVDRSENGRHLYSFRGTPATKTTLDSPKPIYLVQRKNVLLYVWGDQSLAEQLDQVANSH